MKLNAKKGKRREEKEEKRKKRREREREGREGRERASRLDSAPHRPRITSTSSRCWPNLSYRSRIDEDMT